MKNVSFSGNLENPWSNVYGTARSILALGTFLTLAFNDAATLFFYHIRTDQASFVSVPGISKLNFFSLWGDFDTGRIAAMFILLIIISGWKPAITGIFHVWIAISLMWAGTFVNGADKITAILTLLFLPVCITDHRTWHWAKNDDPALKRSNIYLEIFVFSIFLMIRIQVAFIYLSSAIAKLSAKEWANGTAAWYWAHDPVFGYNKWLAKIMEQPLRNVIVVSFLTWLPVIIELGLFFGLFMKWKYRKALLITGIIFHLSVVFFHGLANFMCTMTAALILYLRPVSLEFNFNFIHAGITKKILKVFDRNK